MAHRRIVYTRTWSDQIFGFEDLSSEHLDTVGPIPRGTRTVVHSRKHLSLPKVLLSPGTSNNFVP